MTHDFHVISLEILRVQEDDLGPYAKIKVTLTDGEVTIRWGLDAYTYRHLKGLVFTQDLETAVGPNYKCYLQFEDIPGDPAGTGFVVCHLGNQKTRLSFPCSDLYRSNLMWLRSVQNTEELQSLAWDRWLEYHLDAAQAALENDAAAAQLQTTRTSHPRKQRVRVTAVIVVVVLVLLVVGLWAAYAFERPKATVDAQVPIHGSLSANAVHSNSAGTAKSVSSETSSGATPPPSAPAVQTDKTLSIPALGPPNYREVSRVPAGEVALTFDDGPSPYTSQIVQTLANYHVTATFFFVAENVERFPEGAKAAVAQGDEIGDHSLDHPDLTKLSEEDQEYEITQGAKDIQNLLHVPVVLFRPPYGAFNEETKTVLLEHHMIMALWNRDPRDWEADTPDDVIHRVLSLHASGGVFDLHDNETTADALPKILDALKAQKLKFVVLPTAP